MPEAGGAPAWQKATLESALTRLEADGLLRHRRTVSVQGAGPACVVDGEPLLNFCSNDYLGLAHHPRVVEALAEGARRHGAGSGASHLVTGHHPEHTRLEEALAAYTHREAALLFSTGYMANLAVAQVLAVRGGQVLSDRLNHASLIDAARLCEADVVRYAHGDAAAAGEALAKRAGPALLLTDGVFSMDGDVAPVAALATACHAREAWLAVDDAHGLGVVGATGRGAIEAAGLLHEPDAVPVLIGTLGKAFGTAGAFIAGRRELIELFVQRARTYIYTTALPPALATATCAALEVAQAEPERRAHLQRLVARFRAEAEGLGLGGRLLASATPIQPLLLGTPEAAVAASRALQAQGLLVGAIRPPTVPAGTARLRVTFSAAHTEADLDRLLDALRSVARSLPDLAA